MKQIDYGKYKGHTKTLTVMAPELSNILVTDWSDANIALHLDAPVLLKACKERDERIKKLEDALKQIAALGVNGYSGNDCKKIAEEALR